MGCWMQTCAITRTAIRDGDPCRLVLLATRDRCSRAICNTHDVYAVIEVPFKGTYSDEGFVDIDDPMELQRFQTVARALGFDVDSVEDMPDYDTLMSGGHDHRGFEINYCLVSETVFEYMADDHQKLCEDLSLSIKPLYLKKVAELENDPDPESAFYSSVIAKNPHQVVERLIDDKPEDFFSRETLLFLMFGFGPGSHMHYLWPIFPQGCDPFQRMEGLAELFLVNRFMGSIRGMWSPQAGQGSYEDNGDKQYNLLIKMIDERISRDI